MGERRHVKIQSLGRVWNAISPHPSQNITNEFERKAAITDV